MANMYFKNEVTLWKCKVQRFPQDKRAAVALKKNICIIFLFKINIYMRYEKNNEAPILDQDGQISVTIDAIITTMSHFSLYRLDLFLLYRFTVSLGPILVLGY